MKPTIYWKSVMSKRCKKHLLFGIALLAGAFIMPASINLGLFGPIENIALFDDSRSGLPVLLTLAGYLMLGGPGLVMIFFAPFLRDKQH